MVKRGREQLKTLSIQVTPEGFSFSALDSTKGQITCIAAFQHTPFSTAALEAALAEHQIAKDSLEHLRLNQNHPQFTLVPTAFYDKARARALLAHSIAIGDRDAIRTDDLRALGLHILYVDKLSPLPAALDTRRQTHFLTAFLRFVLEKAEIGEATQVFAHQYQNLLSVLIFRDAKLLLANTYEAHSPSDAVYYLLALFENFSLPNESQPLTLSGALSPQRGLPHQALQAYFGALQPLEGFRNPIHPKASASPTGLIQTHQILLE